MNIPPGALESLDELPAVDEETEMRCPKCLEVKSKITDQFAVIVLDLPDGSEKTIIICQDCSDALPPPTAN